MPGPVFIAGERVSLRTVEAEDLDFLQEQVNDPTVRRYLGPNSPINGQQEREWFEERGSSDDYTSLLVCRDREVVGSVGLYPRDGDLGVTAELGIVLAEPFWGEGYGTEAGRLITEYAFDERRHHRVVARVFDGNVGSQRIWEKLGFRHEATHLEVTFLDGEYVDEHRYAVLEDEWRAE